MNQKLQAMTEGGKLLSQIRDQLEQMVIPGNTLAQIEEKATQLLNETGGEPAFKKVPGYSYSTCINVNSGIVHGIPNNYQIKDGDLVSIDVGLYYQGYYTDTSTSKVAGNTNPNLELLLKAGKECLDAGIKQAKLGNKVGHISQAMEQVLDSYNLSPIPELTGHGVGKTLHEPPYVPCYLERPIDQTTNLKEGQTLAIEAIYTIGDPQIITESDQWTISTKDGKIAGLFEHTVAITSNGPQILTIH